MHQHVGEYVYVYVWIYVCMWVCVGECSFTLAALFRIFFFCLYRYAYTFTFHWPTIFPESLYLSLDFLTALAASFLTLLARKWNFHAAAVLLGKHLVYSEIFRELARSHNSSFFQLAQNKYLPRDFDTFCLNCGFRFRKHRILSFLFGLTFCNILYSGAFERVANLFCCLCFCFLLAAAATFSGRLFSSSTFALGNSHKCI